MPPKAAAAALAFVLIAAALPATATAQNYQTSQTRTIQRYEHDINAPPAFVRNRSAQCVNGYRTTHQVHGNGRVTAGVILKC